MTTSAAQRRRLLANLGKVVGLARSVPGFSSVLGRVEAVGSEWALLRTVNDLRLDGWECVRLVDTTAVLRGASERFAEKIIRSEHPNDVAPPELALGNTATLLSSLSLARLVALECEEDGDFLLGIVVRVSSRSADVYAVNSTGAWGKRAVRVQLADLTRVQFGTHYNAMFERYASARPALRR